MSAVDLVETRINGRWTLLLPRHRAERPEWSAPLGWERERINSMALNLAPGDTLVDVGAEEGDMSGLFASWGCRLILAEPNPLVWPNIRAVWDANHLPAPLAWFVGFCGAEPSTHPSEEWWEQSDPHPSGSGWPRCAHGPVIGDHGFLRIEERPDVATTTLDHLTRGHQVAALTIDVEGAELFVLRGAEQLLTEQRPLVWCSVHPQFMRDHYTQDPIELRRFMWALDYEHHILASDHEEHTLWLPH